MLSQEIINKINNELKKGNEVIIKKNKDNEIKVFRLKYIKKYPAE